MEDRETTDNLHCSKRVVYRLNPFTFQNPTNSSSVEHPNHVPFIPVGAGMAGQTSLNKSKRASGKTQFLLHELEHRRPGEGVVCVCGGGGGGGQGTCLQAPVSDLQS